MDAKLRFFSELYNILSVKSCCKPFKRLFNRLAHSNYYYRMLCRATIDRQKIFFENSLQASWCYLRQIGINKNLAVSAYLFTLKLIALCLHNLSIKQADGAMGYLGIMLIMRYHDDGGALVVQLSKQMHHLGTILGIEVTRRLIG